MAQRSRATLELPERTFTCKEHDSLSNCCFNFSNSIMSSCIAQDAMVLMTSFPAS